MTPHLLLMLLLGCAGEPDKHGSTPRPEIPDAEQPVAAPITAPAEPSEGSLAAPAQVTLGQPAVIAYDRPGPNGCYRQTAVTTQLNTGERRVTHRYTTHSEGDICTQALVPGGFSTEIMLPEVGAWTGRIFVNGNQVASYSLTVAP